MLVILFPRNWQPIISVLICLFWTRRINGTSQHVVFGVSLLSNFTSCFPVSSCGSSLSTSFLLTAVDMWCFIHSSISDGYLTCFPDECSYRLIFAHGIVSSFECIPRRENASSKIMQIISRLLNIQSFSPLKRVHTASFVILKGHHSSSLNYKTFAFLVTPGDICSFSSSESPSLGILSYLGVRDSDRQ